MLYVIEVDQEQALANNHEQCRAAIIEKFTEKLDRVMTDKANVCGDEAVKRNLYVNVEVTEHKDGTTGWTKKRR